MGRSGLIFCLEEHGDEPLGIKGSLAQIRMRKQK